MLPVVLEADRSTENHQRLRRKMSGYVHYVLQGRAEKTWNIKFFRVLTVTETTARAVNLENDLQDILPPQLRPHYLFTTLDALTLDTLIRQTAAASAP